MICKRLPLKITADMTYSLSIDVKHLNDIRNTWWLSLLTKIHHSARWVHLN